jgi:hypothetical protein
MNKAQKNELIRLIGIARTNAIEYGIIYDRTQHGEYVREDLILARQKALNNAMRNVYEHIDSID